MLKSSLCDYSVACILVNGTIAITGAAEDAAARNAGKRNKKVTYKYCAPFTDCISKISNTEVHNTTDLDVVILMYNLIEHNDSHAEISAIIIITKQIINYSNLTQE